MNLTCVICGRARQQPHKARAATCSRSCGARLANDTKASQRAWRLRLDTLSPLAAYALGYKTGYQRGWAHTKRESAA